MFMNCSPHLTGLQEGLRHGIPGKAWMVPLKVLQGELENNLAWGIPGVLISYTAMRISCVHLFLGISRFSAAEIPALLVRAIAKRPL
jgi:hypothetical protein